MTNMGFLEGATSAIGDELNDLFGYASTRLTAIAYPERQLQSGTSSLNYNGTSIVQLTSGSFLAEVAAGMKIRLLSGAFVGYEATVLTRDSSTQCTLSPTFPFVTAQTGVSWEIVIPADTTLNVENATEFTDAPGRVVLDGCLYWYTGKTATTLTGITNEGVPGGPDGQDTSFSGVKQQHKTRALVSDYSRAKNALDQYRRSFMVETAEGKDLDVVGSNLGVDRPPELEDDDVYRRLIMAVAYTPRGTIFAMEQVLDALLGETVIASGTNAKVTGDEVLRPSGTFPTGIEGMRFRITSGRQAGRTIRIKQRVSATELLLNIPFEEDVHLEDWEITDPDWDLFEDLTMGSLHHACEVFFRRKDNLEEQFVGKTFLDGYDFFPLDTTDTIDFTGQGHLRIASVKLKNEGGMQKVATGTLAESVDGIVITAPAFPTTVMKGDWFQITSGKFKGQFGTILSRDSGTQITLGLTHGLVNRSENSTGTIGAAFSGASWQVFRDKTNCGLYRPSAESRPEYTGDAGTATWTYLGSSENTKTTVENHATFGPRLLLSPGATLTGYQRPIRITPESTADVEILLDPGTGLSDTATDCKQFACLMADGERVLAWGVRDDTGNLQSLVGFIDVVTGQLLGSGAIWSDVEDTKFTPGLATIKMTKTGRGTVKLYKQSWQGAHTTSGWKLIEEVAYDDFPTVGDWTAAANYTNSYHEIVWGTLEDTYSNTTAVKHVDWHVHNTKDFWNLHGTAETSADSELEDLSSPFLVSDEGKLIRIKDFGAVNADGGNALGVWEIVARDDADHITLAGPVQYRGYFDLLNPRALFVRGDSPFVWPNHRGHVLEILTGPNAGSYDIEEIINPETMESFDDLPLPETIADSLDKWLSKDQIAITRRSHIIQLDSGVDFEVDNTECTFRILPIFPVGDTDVDYELIDAGEDSAGNLTLREAPGHPVGTVMSVYSSKVLSGYLFHPAERNELDPPDYTMYPFYLYDAFGYVKTIMKIIKAAGIRPDFTRLTEDAAGKHILGS